MEQSTKLTLPTPGVPPLLSGFVCAFHSAAVWFKLSFELECEKIENKQNEAGIGLFFKKNYLHQFEAERRLQNPHHDGKMKPSVFCDTNQRDSVFRIRQSRFTKISTVIHVLEKSANDFTV